MVSSTLNTDAGVTVRQREQSFCFSLRGWLFPRGPNERF